MKLKNPKKRKKRIDEVLSSIAYDGSEKVIRIVFKVRGKRKDGKD